MQLKKYPYRTNVRKVLEKFVASKDIVDFYKRQGILIHAIGKKDIAKIGSDFYFSRSQFIELKQKIEDETNYKTSSRISIPKTQLNELKTALQELQYTTLNEEDDTKITVSSLDENTWNFSISYTEYKPGMIDLLDRTDRCIDVKINSINETTSSLDFDINSKGDYKKVSSILQHIQTTYKDSIIEFSEIQLSKLSRNLKIQLFDDFFKHDFAPWEFRQIKKLKIKRDDAKDTSEKEEVSTDNLAGINSAILSGKNLIDNAFVKTTLDSGFYFSMATMRFVHKETREYLEVLIEFKSRPEKCETKIITSGLMIPQDEDGAEPLETNSIFSYSRQDEILFMFKNVLYNLYQKAVNDVSSSFSIEMEDEELVKK